MSVGSIGGSGTAVPYQPPLGVVAKLEEEKSLPQAVRRQQADGPYQPPLGVAAKIEEEKNLPQAVRRQMAEAAEGSSVTVSAGSSDPNRGGNVNIVV